MRRRTVLVPLGVLVLFAAGTGTSLAQWSSPGSGTGRVRTATLHKPDHVTVTLRPAGVVVNWDKARLSTGQPALAYYVTRIKGNGTTSAACGTSPSATTGNTRCTDNPPTAGNYRYRVTAVFRSWTATSAATDRITVVVAGNPAAGNPAGGNPAGANPPAGDPPANPPAAPPASTTADPPAAPPGDSTPPAANTPPVEPPATPPVVTDPPAPVDPGVTPPVP